MQFCRTILEIQIKYLRISSLEFNSKIIKKNPSNIWKEGEIYNDERLINTLGNFVLASQKTNSSFGNRDWVVKKVLYQSQGKIHPVNFLI